MGSQSLDSWVTQGDRNAGGVKLRLKLLLKAAVPDDLHGPDERGLDPELCLCICLSLQDVCQVSPGWSRAVWSRPGTVHQAAAPGATADFAYPLR